MNDKKSNPERKIVMPGSIDFILGHYEPSEMPDFVLIDQKYADKEGMYMQREAYEAFLRMAAAGEADGHSFCILSATRTFEYQKMLWENKWNGISTIDGNIKADSVYPDGLARARKLLEYSAMPGTSRHHWGTDIDINGLDNQYFEGKGLPCYRWMQKHAASFGYHQPYTAFDKSRNKGYLEEKWHWSYLPLARKYTTIAADTFNDQLIKGFAGDTWCDQLDVVETYILGIDPQSK